MAEVLAGGPAPAKDPFWDAVVAYAVNRHPTEKFTMDIAGTHWASIWLTSAEFATPRCEIPEPHVLPRFESDHMMEPDGEDRPSPLRLEECHVDPNAGRPATTEYDEDNLTDEEWGPEPCHFGGTVAYYNGSTYNTGTGESELGPSGISPWYLEFNEELSGANLGGGGSALFDLRTGQIDSSC